MSSVSVTIFVKWTAIPRGISLKLCRSRDVISYITILCNHWSFNGMYIETRISTETICLVALLRRGLLRALFSVAILFLRADSRRRISLRSEKLSRVLLFAVFVGTGFHVLYARCSTTTAVATTIHTLTLYRQHHRVLLSSLNPFYSRFILLSVPHLSTADIRRYCRHRASARRKMLS